jgi:hypothetical protein
VAITQGDIADILSQVMGIKQEQYDNKAKSDDRPANDPKNQSGVLVDIRTDVRAIRQLLNGSQSAYGAKVGKGPNFTSTAYNVKHAAGTTTGNSKKGFEDAFKKAFTNQIFGDFQKQVKDIPNIFAQAGLGGNGNLGSTLGKSLGESLLNTIKGTDIGKSILGDLSKGSGALGTAATSAASAFADSVAGGAGAMEGLGAAAEAAGPALAEAAVALGPFALAVGAAIVVLDALGPAIDGTKKLFEGMSQAADRTQTSTIQYMELGQQRLTDDINTMVKAPFQILQNAANDLADAWQSNIRTINQTQGYTKADLQNLMTSYAQRLRSSGLSKEVSSVDIENDLTKVLQAGLSGAVANEFAYQATVLNAAIPTQDFFGYADQYASLAANAMQAGMSQADAISYADDQLNSFADDVLYASRQLAGGFSTGLQNASDLFASAVQISQAAHTNNPSGIAGVLTSVAAVTGAIAPDLATGLTNAIVKLATGGNDSSLVALRSLANVGASNTAFLQAIATNPQQTFATMFSNLGQMQNMSPGNYMEVAENLANLFGIDMSAFSRIDFNSLANAVKDMSTSSAALSQNLDLLKSGQTTTSTQSLAMQQINQFVLSQGLSDVIDNSTAMAIQQHLWDEQMNEQLLEATYGVNLEGDALKFLEGVYKTVMNIMSILNPIMWLQKLTNLSTTAAETGAQQNDIKTFLQLSQVGNGNAAELAQLTTRGVAQNVTPNLISLMGGTSQYATMEKSRQVEQAVLGTLGTGLLGALTTSMLMNSGGVTGTGATNIGSQYSWGTVGKSALSLLSAGSGGISAGAPLVAPAGGVLATPASNSAIANFIQTAQSAASNKMSYDEWASTARNYGIADLATAAKNYGTSTDDLQQYFQNAQTTAGAAATKARSDTEEQFWTNEQANTLRIGDLIDGSKTGTTNDILSKLYADSHSWMMDSNGGWSKFYQDWTNYITGKIYADAMGSATVSAIQAAEKQNGQDAVTALADALTTNLTNLQNPQVQTNVLLAQILNLVDAIMKQNASGGGMSLGDSLIALATGMTK